MAETHNGVTLKKMMHNGAQVKKWIHNGKSVYSAELDISHLGANDFIISGVFDGVNAYVYANPLIVKSCGYMTGGVAYRQTCSAVTKNSYDASLFNNLVLIGTARAWDVGGASHAPWGSGYTASAKVHIINASNNAVLRTFNTGVYPGSDNSHSVNATVSLADINVPIKLEFDAEAYANSGIAYAELALSTIKFTA